MHLTLKLLNGEVMETTVESDVVTIGRSPKCLVQVPQDGISRQHVQIELINGELFITDTNSTNGVYIDNVKIEANKKIPYQTYLLLSFGAVQSLQIELDAAPLIERFDKSATAPGIKKEEQKTLTKTRQISTPRPTAQKVAPPKRKQIEGEVSKTNFWISNILILSVLAAIAYWYMTSDMEKVDYDKPAEDEVESIPIPGQE